MKRLLFGLVILGFLVFGSRFSYAQNAKLTVPAEVTGDTIILNPLGSAPAASEGRVYYNNNDNVLYYRNNTSWQNFSSDRYVATRIVAASNSLDKEEKADNVCTGTQTTGGDDVNINSAINYLGSAGGVVYLLEGNFWISDSINVPSKVAIIGTGAGTVISPKNSAPLNNRGVITNSDQTNGNSDILVQNLKIDGNKANNINAQYGIYFSKVNYSTIYQVKVENMKDDGIGFFSSNYNIISNTVEAANDYGVYLVTSNNNIVSGNNFESNYVFGIMLYFSSNNTVSGNSVTNNVTSDGIYLSNSTDNIVSGNNSSFNGSNGVCLENSSSNNTVTGNHCRSNTEYGIHMYTSSNGNIVSGNTAQSNRKNGIRVDTNASNNAILGNIVYDNGLTSSNDGIIILNSSSNNFISSNRISDTAGPSSGTAYMINIATANCSNNYIAGNETSLPASYSGRLAQFQDLGTSTRYMQKEKVTIERQAAVVPANGSTLDVTTNPKGYVPLAPTGAVTLNGTTAIANGKSVGDILYLEGTSNTNYVTIPNGANVRLSSNTIWAPDPTATLKQEDILVLIWNGSYWVEIASSKNH